MHNAALGPTHRRRESLLMQSQCQCARNSVTFSVHLAPMMQICVSRQYIILLKSLSVTQFGNGRSQLLLDRLGRCLKLFVSTDSTSSHELASQFGLAFFYTRKTLNTSGKPGRQCQCLFQWPATTSRPAIVASGAGRHGWLAQTHRIAVRR